MGTLAELLQPIDPFRLQPDWLPKWASGESTLFSLRPVYIPGDLRILLRWRNGKGESAPPIAVRGGRLIHHLRQMLQSDQAQSFLMSKLDLPIAQFDIESIDHHPLYKRIITRAGDVVIENHSNSINETNLDWKDAVVLFIGIVCSCTDVHAIFISSESFSFNQLSFLESIDFKEIQLPNDKSTDRILKLQKSDFRSL